MKTSDIFAKNITFKRQYIRNFLRKNNLLFKVQQFSIDEFTGLNFWVLDWLKPKKENIYITVHYDGFGAYDNDAGVIVVMWMLKWLMKDRESNLKNNIGLVIIFTDGEERGLLGAKNVMNFKEVTEVNVIKHLAVDGIGIGTQLVGFANLKNIKLQTAPEDYRTFHIGSESTVFQDLGIPSIHLFTLPEKDFYGLLNHQIFPDIWRIVHTQDDNLQKINDDFLPFSALSLIKNLSNIKFNSNGIIILGN